MSEHQIVVVFDVTATDRLSAGRAVVGLINGTRGRFTLPDRLIADSIIESWWFPEADLKQVDRNDNAAGYLVFDDDSPSCSDPTCSPDGLHYTGRRHPDTNEDIETGPCPRWALTT